AWVLMIGVGFNRCTLLHHSQARYLAAHEGVTAETPWPHFDFSEMGELLDKAGIVTHAKLGNAECLLGRAGDLIDHSMKILETDSATLFKDEKVAAWKTQYDSVKELGRPEAAVFKLDVTPPVPGREVARPLHLRGILLDHPQDGRGVLLLWDHCVFYKNEGEIIRRAVAEAADIPIERVMLTATHTHSGYGDPFVADPEYVEFVARKAALGAREAIKRLEPVRAGWTTVQAPGISRNRNVYLKKGGAYTERWAIPSTWHVPEDDMLKRGDHDEEIRILSLERLDGSHLAIFADLSCHNSAALLDEMMNDDFFGVAMGVLEEVEGADCVALIAPGSQGDHDPTGMVELGGDRDLAYAERLGRRLSGYMLSAIQNIETRDLFDLRFGSAALELKARDAC
ncbi:MAG: AAC(3) family N-acetyltransferase, partial [Victivallales bacterium]|nr:AAC(3) family N-acetyltransferase [Victivallales bacterium]